MTQRLFAKKYLSIVLLFSNEIFPGIKFSSNRSTFALDKTNSALTLVTSLSGVDGTIKLRTTTGTTDGNVNSATGAETISFSGGSLQLGANIVDLTGGSYDPKVSGRDTLTLSSSQIMSVSAGTTLYNDVLVASGQSATIVGTPTFVSSVSLGNSSSVLNLGIQHKLNQDLVLNGGKIVLIDDLSLQDGVRIWGPGTIDINYQSMQVGASINSSIWSKNLIFWRAKDIQLNGSMTLAGKWSFLTNSTDNESMLNGNGNVLTLAGPGKIVVGDATGGHTLYISDLHIKGLSDAAYTVASSMSKTQYAALSGLAGSSVTAGNLAYDEDFAALSTNSTTVVNWDGISVYDDASLAAPLVYGVRKGGSGGLLGSSTASGTSTTVTNLNGAVATNVDVDAGTDGTYVWADNTNKKVQLYNGSATVDIRTTTSYNGTYQSITNGSMANNYIYAVKSSALTAVSKYSGTPDTWNDSWATGYTAIVDIAASNDGYVWVLDNVGGGVYTITKTNGGTKSSGTSITVPEAPTTYGSAIPSRNALSIKGASTSPYGAYCGASGTVYYSVDGTTFSAIGSFGATGVAVGAQGTIAFTGPNDAATPGYANGLAVFVRAAGTNVFSLYGDASDANRGKVVLSNVTMELKRNYTHGAGHITVRGSNCTLISGGTKTFNVSGATTPFEVDSVALIYETLSGANVSPFTGTAVTLTNGGVVRSAISSVVPVDYTIDANAYNGSSAPTLTKNYTLFASGGRIVVTNGSGAASQTVTVDGGNYFWQFPGGTVNALSIADKVTVTLTNVVLKDFSLANVSFGGANAALVFGDGCVIELGADQSLTTGQGAWTIGGNASIRGAGQTVTLNNANSLRQNAAGKTLTVENTILKSLNVTSLGCDAASTVALNNSTVMIDSNGLTWGNGSLDINGYTRLACINALSSGASSNFNLTTAGVMTVNAGSTLELGRAINFVYNPNTTGDGGATTSAAKRHFRVGLSGDASATLYANNCSINATAVGMALDRGNFVVDNRVDFTASSTASYESELGSALNVEILAAGILNLDGGVKYTSTTV